MRPPGIAEDRNVEPVTLRPPIDLEKSASFASGAEALEDVIFWTT